MTRLALGSLLALCALVAAAQADDKFNQDKDWHTATSIYQFQANDLEGKNVHLSKYQGHVLVVVNVASNCTLTAPNYQQLQSLYEKYGKSKGLRILAFPSNQFGGQEPGTPEQIRKFVSQYGVTFDMFAKIEVNGDNAHPLYKWLKSRKEGSGPMSPEIKWNFAKFIVDKNGRVVARFTPWEQPLTMEETLIKFFTY